MSIAVELLGNGLIGGLIVSGGAKDDAAAEDEGLWGGPSPYERLELPADLAGQGTWIAPHAFPLVGTRSKTGRASVALRS
jgi:hypothetical protein